MTNPASPSEPSASDGGLPDAGPSEAAPQRPAKVKRKGPRRATAPAGAPAVSKRTAAGVLLVDADGQVLQPPVDPAATPAPAGAVHAPVKAEVPASGAPAGADMKLVEPPSAVAEPAPAKPTHGGANDNDVPGGGLDADAAAGSPSQGSVKDPTPDARTPRAPDQAAQDSPAGSAPASPPAPVVSGDVETRVATTPPGPATAGGVRAEAGRATPDPAAAGKAGPDKAGPGLAASGPETGTTPADGSAHQSRRERRLAEQKTGAGVGTSASARETATIPAPDAASSTAAIEEPAAESSGPSTTGALEAPRPPAPARKRTRFSLLVRGVLSFLLISLLVATLGTVLVGQDDSAAGPADTELNRGAAQERTAALSATAALLSATAGTPQLAQALGSTARKLDVQAAALDDGLAAPDDDATFVARIAATDGPTNPAAPTLVDLLEGLTNSGEELMQDALTAERAMGRVFAAVGTGQLLEAKELGAAAGTTPPASAFLSTPPDFAAPQGPLCSSTLDPRSGVTVDSALLAAALGEQKAVYGYQVATTRLAEPQLTKAMDLLARHQEKLDLINAELTVRCLQQAVPVAGFDLDPAFTATPAAALAQLESELTSIHAGLVALSTPAPESAPAGTLSTAPAASVPPTAAAPDAVPSADVSTIQPANNGLLREMSTAWLLDSAVAENYWGGTVDALPGMEP